MVTLALLRRAALVETISWTLLLLAGILWLITQWTIGLWIMVPVDCVIWTTFAVIAAMVAARQGWPRSNWIQILGVSLIPVWGYFWIRDKTSRASNANFES